MNKKITRLFKISFCVKPLAVIWMVYMVCSCENPFSTRTPEPPKDQQRTNWIQPTNAKDVLTNLQNAIQDKNLTNYMNCFTNTPKNERHFGYKPDHNALIRYPGLWSEWSLEHEQTYITNVFHAIPNDSLFSLIFFGEGIENPFPDSTIIIREYELNIGHNRDSEQFPKRVKGRSEFRLSENTAGFWAIYFWIDDSFEGSPSWSNLKASFIQ